MGDVPRRQVYLRCNGRALITTVAEVTDFFSPCGKPAAADLRSARLLATHTLREPLDTLLLLDRKVKHEVGPIEQEDRAAGDAIRDVLTFEVRRAGDVESSSAAHFSL